MRLRVIRKHTKFIAIASALVVLLAIFGWQITRNVSQAADIRNFDPGNIMSDAVMSNKNTMSTQDIQNFLNSKNYCDNRDIHKAAWYPNLKYNIKDGKFVCMARDSFDGQSAAQIIWQVAQDYSINPQFLLVLLEKEQGLISDTWPNSRQYQTATGFGCPDTAACDTKYFGLKNQLQNAASLFRTVLNGGWSNYPVGQTYVQYHPNASCGGSVINIQNRATSALYRYTPYQPNRSALEAGYGTGDSCGAYGNRNTWRLFTDWFGPTDNNSYQPLQTPRWMQARSDNTKKVNIFTDTPAGSTIAKGQQIRFVDKIYINGHWYLRSEYNFNDKSNFGIRQDLLENISYSPIQPKLVSLTTNASRSHPSSRTSAGDYLESGTLLKVVDDIIVDSNTYYRTEYNSLRKQDFGLHSRFVVDGILPIPLEGPRYFCAIPSKGAERTNLSLGTNLGKSSEPIYVTHKIKFNGTWYFRVSENDNNVYVKSTELTSSNCMNYVAFDNPRDMILTKTAGRINPYTREKYDTLASGSILHFSSKIFVNNSWYYRTTHNTQNNINAAIPASVVANYTSQ